MIVGEIQGGAQGARTAVRGVGDDGSYGWARTINGGHAGAVTGAEGHRAGDAHEVDELRVGGEGDDGVEVGGNREIIAGIVHDGQEVIRALFAGVGKEDEVADGAVGDVVGHDGHEGIAIGTLVFVNKPKRVADFVANRSAIEGIRTDGKKLLAAHHALVGLAAFQTNVFRDGDVIGLRGARDEMQIGEHGPFPGGVEKRPLMQGGDVVGKSVIDIAARPGRGDAVKGTLGRSDAGELVAPGGEFCNEDSHVADGHERLAGLDAGENLIEGGDVPIRVLGNGAELGRSEEENAEKNAFDEAGKTSLHGWQLSEFTTLE